MSLFERYIQHTTAATTGRTALVDTGAPMGAGRMALLTSNALHLCEQNPVRALRQHPGMRDFYASASPGTGFTDPPDVVHIRWNLSPKDGSAVLDLGTFYVWQRPDGRLPRLRLSFWTQIDGGHTLGWVWAVSPGTRGPLSATSSTAAVTTSSTWSEASVVLDLSDRDVGPLVVAPTNGIDEDVDPAEGGRLRVFRSFVGAYNSYGSNTAGHLANLVGLSLRAEAP